MIRGAANATSGRKVTPPTSSELAAIASSITPRYRAAVLLPAWGALRYGELTELQRKDIRTQIDRGPSNDCCYGRACSDPHDRAWIHRRLHQVSSRHRVIPLPPHINSAVEDHLRLTGPSESLLFPARDGNSHLAESTFVKHWYPARERAGRPDLPFHALRHYGATKYAQTGATLKEIQEHLGHSTVVAAMKYQHAAGRDAELARRMSELEAL